MNDRASLIVSPFHQEPKCTIVQRLGEIRWNRDTEAYALTIFADPRNLVAVTANLNEAADVNWKGLMENLREHHRAASKRIVGQERVEPGKARTSSLTKLFSLAGKSPLRMSMKAKAESLSPRRASPTTPSFETL